MAGYHITAVVPVHRLNTPEQYAAKCDSCPWFGPVRERRSAADADGLAHELVENDESLCRHQARAEVAANRMAWEMALDV